MSERLAEELKTLIKRKRELATSAETYDTLQIQRGKALEIFSLLGKTKGTLLYLQGKCPKDNFVVAQAENGIQAIHLVIEYLTPSLPTLVEEYKEKMKDE